MEHVLSRSLPGPDVVQAAIIFTLGAKRSFLAPLLQTSPERAELILLHEGLRPDDLPALHRWILSKPETALIWAHRLKAGDASLRMLGLPQRD